ncbi:MAG: T9SS type A sorting domain-containing protein, partial [Bacteroidota bacterium]
VELAASPQLGTICHLYSPVFDAGNIVNSRITFWQNRNTSVQEDGTTLEYSLNGGAGPWQVLGSVGCATCVNWYTNTSFTSGFPQWDGSSGGWIKSDFIFPAGFVGSPTFELRFTYTNSQFTNSDGMSIDDFCFSLPEPNDPGLANIISPNGNAPAGTCLPVTVTIHNYGSNNLDSTNVYYAYNGDTLGPFLWSGPTLGPGEESTFTMPCDTILQGANTFCAWVVLGGDPNHTNDTACTNIFGIPTIVIDSIHPFCDDFDGSTTNWFAEIEPGASASIWQWGTPSFGLTNSANSAPNAWDVDLTSGYLDDANTYLYTPFFDITQMFNPYISFWINYDSETFYDGVRLEYKTDTMLTWSFIDFTPTWYPQPNIQCSGSAAWAGANPSSGGWIHIQQDDLTSLLLSQSSFVQFRFRFCSDPSITYSGASIDDFCFAMPAPYDAGVTTVLQPSFSAPVDSCVPVEVTIKNFGYNQLTSINVYYSKDDLPYGNPVTYGPFVWTGTLLPGASTTWILPVCDTVPSGAYNFCSWTELLVPQTDGNFFNDTSCTQSIGVPTIPLSFTNSYCDDFESGNIGWSVQTTGAPSSNWEFGTPGFGQTNSAHSGTTAWDVNLTTFYDDNANTVLYTPYFDIQGVGTILDFFTNFNTSIAQDGVKFEFNIGNTNWVQLFNTGTAINWYNGVACGQAAWAGTSTTLQNPLPGGWAEVKFTLPAQFDNAGEVQFRFTFCSGQFGFPTDGFSIDDFCLIVPVPLTASPVSCHNTASPPFIFPGQAISFDTDVKNKGTTPLDSVVVQLFIDNNLISAETVNYSPALTLGQTANHVFTNTWVTTPGVHNVCNVTTFPNGGTDQNPTDDTLCCSISVIDTVSVATSDYCPDFDTAPQWVTLNAFPPYAPTSSWAFGQPNAGFMTAAHSGTNAWKTGSLTGNYPDKDSSALFTPAFNIQVGRTYELSFWHEKDFEIYQDGGNVEYSTDFGASWTILGTGGSLTWYDSWFVTALGGTPPSPGWSITLAAWEHPSHTICFLPQNGQMAYPVMFRFRFASDYSVNHLGWLIDDFCFKDVGNCPVGITELGSASGLMLGQNRPNPTNSMTSIDYMLPETGKVVMKIANLLGQDMDTPVDEEQTSGMHTVNFNTKNLSPGIYYYSLTFNKETLVKKMVITK